MSALSGHEAVDELALRHLDAAYNLGRWLLGNEQDAADAVHDAYLRASRFAATYAGGDARAWWLAIVRNCCHARLALRKRDARNVAANDDDHATWMPHSDSDGVERLVDDVRRHDRLVQAMEALPVEFRETIVLRELEELSYREIADILAIPIGTVMSRLARGRAMLQKALSTPKGDTDGA